MLQQLRLRSLGVIKDAVVELGPGFTVVTGETGAGKTMVVTALGLLLGARGDAGAVRSGDASLLVEARLQIDPAARLARRVEDAGGALDDGDVLIVGRSVTAEGRSRAQVGGRAAPVAVLGEVTGELITVHGQTDQLRLKSPVRQREALDRFAGAELTAPLEAYRATFRRLREVDRELHEITDQARQRAQEAELLRLGVAEVERVEPLPGEDVELRAEAERLAHAEELHTAASGAHTALAGDDDTDAAATAVGLVDAARRALEHAGHHDAALAALAGRAAEVGYLLADLAADCAAYVDGVEADPLRQAAVEERRAALAALTRVHGDTIDEVLAWAGRASARLLELDQDDEHVEALTAERLRLREVLAGHAARLTAVRVAAAARLAEAVTGELQGLAMPDARLHVDVRHRPDPAGLPVDLGDGAGVQTFQAGPEGVDEIELLLAPHPGAPARAVGKGASGGELSRVMLAIEVVLGGVDPVPTFVFDEVDAGVGGQAALEIGRRLARLARASQVIVVTHLPQVAAFADLHLKVEKSSDGAVTVSGVRPLDDTARVRELARMLGGVADSDSAQAHAEELIALASTSRDVDPVPAG